MPVVRERVEVGPNPAVTLAVMCGLGVLAFLAADMRRARVNIEWMAPVRGRWLRYLAAGLLAVSLPTFLHWMHVRLVKADEAGEFLPNLLCLTFVAWGVRSALRAVTVTPE